MVLVEQELRGVTQRALVETQTALQTQEMQGMYVCMWIGLDWIFARVSILLYLPSSQTHIYISPHPPSHTVRRLELEIEKEQEARTAVDEMLLVRMCVCMCMCMYMYVW